MAYCTVDDLLIGDLPISDLVDKQTYVDDAAEEIDAAIGEVYVVPVAPYMAPVDLDPTPPTGYNHRTGVLLKRINAHLATGRLVAMLAIGSEDGAIHAYAKSLIDGAHQWINRVAAGQVKLDGADTLDTTAGVDNGPFVSNYDEISAVDAFTNFAMRPAYGQSVRWAPGPVSAD